MKAIINGVEYEDVCVEFCEGTNCFGCEYCECSDPACIEAREGK